MASRPGRWCGMSEFVECQNCGRRFFAENLDCPYCGDQTDVEALMEEVSGSAHPEKTSRSSFRLVVSVVALLMVLGFLLTMLRLR